MRHVLPRSFLALALLLLAIVALVRYGAAQDTPLAVGGATLPAGAELTTLQNSCRACHSFGLVTQQRLSAATWKAEVDKMRGFGAPLPAANEASVVRYLAAHLGPTVPLVPPKERVPAPPITYTSATH